MRNRTFFRGCLASAFAASLAVLPVSAEAKNDFDALLADIDFGGAPKAVEATSAPVDVDPLPETSGLDLPEPSQPAPEAVQAPVESVPMSTPPASHAYSTAGPVATSSCAPSCDTESCGHSGCGHQGCKSCLGKRVTEGYCMPYMPPQIPTSTFYQYWRTNACNVNVWDGFRNRCHPHVDLTIKKKHGCSLGTCSDVYNCGTATCGDCGPPPAEWLGGTADCDSCD